MQYNVGRRDTIYLKSILAGLAAAIGFALLTVLAVAAWQYGSVWWALQNARQDSGVSFVVNTGWFPIATFYLAAGLGFIAGFFWKLRRDSHAGRR